MIVKASHGVIGAARFEDMVKALSVDKCLHFGKIITLITVIFVWPIY